MTTEIPEVSRFSSTPPGAAEIGRMSGERSWQSAPEGSAILRGYRRYGRDSRAGIFIHGFRSHCDGQKARQLSRLAGARGYGWLRFDQRGCGTSDGDPREYTISQALTDLKQAIDTLDADTCILVGSSLGGLLAVYAARALPHRVRGLLLIAPALRFTDRFIHKQMNDRSVTGWRRRGYHWFPDTYEGGCFRLNYSFCADALRYRAPPTKLPCPVHVLHGSADEVLPLADTKNWITHLDCPHRALEIVEGGDHRLTGWTDKIARHTETLWEETPKSCA